MVVLKDEFDGLIKVVAYFTAILKNILFATCTRDLPILNRSVKY